MKRCLLCHYVDRDDCDTCPDCGECTWMFAAVEPVDEEAVAGESEAPKRRGRK